jgi:hypothetical protein
MKVMKILANENWAEVLYGVVALSVIAVSLYAVNSARLGSKSSWEIWSEHQAKAAKQLPSSQTALSTDTLPTVP